MVFCAKRIDFCLSSLVSSTMGTALKSAVPFVFCSFFATFTPEKFTDLKSAKKQYPCKSDRIFKFGNFFGVFISQKFTLFRSIS